MKSKIKTINETYTVRGESITIKARVRFNIETGETIFDKELDEANIQKVYDIYRKKYNILSSQKITELRKNYGLTQKDMSHLLGWGDVTISRYENGSLPSNSHNETFIQFKDPAFVKNLIARNGYKLSSSNIDKINNKVEEFSIDPMPAILEEKLNRAPDILNGYRRFSFERIRELIIYFTHQKSIYKTVLNKLLFYTDFNAYNLFVVSVTGGIYKRMQFGPVPDWYETILEDIEHCGDITSKTNSDGMTTFKACREPNWEVFNTEEQVLIKKIHRKFSNFSAKEISKISHQESAWRNTENKKVIPYDFADDLIEKIEL